jgi:hypothetical protein
MAGNLDGRYFIFGMPAQERESNLGLDPADQQVQDAVVVYDTNSADEAKEIVRAGGFIRDEQWITVQYAQDMQTGNTFGKG